MPRLRILIASLSAVVGCAKPPAPTNTETSRDPVDCDEPPLELVGDLSRPFALTPCMPSLEPPELDPAARARAIETIDALGPADPHSLVLANQVAISELAAANWNGLDEPEVLARLRSTITLLEPIVGAKAHANSQILDVGLMALVCAYTLLDEPEQARTRAQELLFGHSGMWMPPIYLAVAELSGEQTAAINYYERVAEFVNFEAYAKYRLAWALRHPTIIDQDRAVQLLEELLTDTQTWPRLDRALRHRAALELRALGREVEVPQLRCEP